MFKKNFIFCVTFFPFLQLTIIEGDRCGETLLRLGSPLIRTRNGTKQ